MNTEQIADMQRRIGVEPDGFWGPISIAACQRHLRDLMPSPNPWPRQSRESLESFYGPPGEGGLVNLDVVGLGVKYIGAPVKTIRCHRKVAESLRRALEAISKTPDAEILAKYAGCYNYRRMRNGVAMSTHAWGIAIDLWPSRNGNTVYWPTRAEMPLNVMESFAREGWLAAGAFWSRDAMHFQATQ